MPLRRPGEAGDKATDEEAAIEAALSEAEEAVKGDDKAAMEAATQLTEASGSLAQKMYAEQAQAAEGAAEPGAEAEQGALLKKASLMLSLKKLKTISKSLICCEMPGKGQCH